MLAEKSTQMYMQKYERNEAQKNKEVRKQKQGCREEEKKEQFGGFFSLKIHYDVSLKTYIEVLQ